MTNSFPTTAERRAEAVEHLEQFRKLRESWADLRLPRTDNAYPEWTFPVHVGQMVLAHDFVASKERSPAFVAATGWNALATASGEAGWFPRVLLLDSPNFDKDIPRWMPVVDPNPSSPIDHVLHFSAWREVNPQAIFEIVDATTYADRMQLPNYGCATLDSEAGGTSRQKGSEMENKFKIWLGKVDAALIKAVGIGVHDLSDQPYYDWFDDGVGPTAAAKKALKGNW